MTVMPETPRGARVVQMIRDWWALHPEDDPDQWGDFDLD